MGFSQPFQGLEFGESVPDFRPVGVLFTVSILTPLGATTFVVDSKVLLRLNKLVEVNDMWSIIQHRSPGRHDFLNDPGSIPVLRGEDIKEHTCRFDPSLRRMISDI